MSNKYIFYILLPLTLAAGRANAQVADLWQAANPIGFGIRVSPDGAGASAKFFLDPHIALEGLISGSGGYLQDPSSKQNYGPSFTITGLVEYNIIFNDPSWRIFIGPGLHTGSWDRFNHKLGDSPEPTQGIFGVDGIVGVEYLFKTIPLGLSLDAKPAYDLRADETFFPNNLYGFSARIYLGHKVRLIHTEKG